MDIRQRILLFAPAALLLTACTSTEPKPSQRISFSATIGSAGALASTSGPAASLVVTGTGGSVRIDTAQIVLARLKLASNTACSATTGDDADDSDKADTAKADTAHAEPSPASNDESDCEPVNLGPVLVNLPLDGTTKVILDALVPAGTYTGLRAKLEAVEDDDDGASPFLTAHPNFKGVSVRVVGAFTDAGGTAHPFTFTSDAEAVVRMEFPTPVTVGAATSNLTIDVNVASWFKDASGAVTDPTNSANQGAIEKAIRESLRAFEDDDHDGTDDHAEAGGH